MKAFTDTYNLCLGAVVAALTAVFGIYWYIFVAYMILNVIDWITGWYRSYKLKQESSKEEDFTQDRRTLFELEVDIDIYPISENELEGITLTPEQALGIEPIMEVVE